MRHKNYIFFIICICLLFPLGQVTFGQVTIGSLKAPVPGALLDLKEWAATSTNPTTANKGLLLPRVSLKAETQLTPLYGGVDNGDGTWTDHSTAEEKKASTGMMVYNINENAINIYRAGICTWDGEKWVSLQNNASTYTVDCSSVEVKGLYKKNETLNATNTITMNITVAVGGMYKITTDQVHGISFEGAGMLPAGTHTITLEGRGTLTLSYPFDITLNAKTATGNIACTTTVPVTYPNMTYAVIGAGSVYSWAGTPRKALLDASTQPGGSFSPTGTVRVGALTLWGSATGSVTTAKTNLGWAYFNANGTLDPNLTYPDVILYYSYGANADAELAPLLSAYINAGGCILFGSQDNSFGSVNFMVNAIFGLPNAAQQQIVNGDDDVYPIANLPNDPIINGPFGDLAGKHWGEDNASSGSIILTQLPANSVQICTARSEKKSLAAVPLSNSIVWYNDAKNFVYIGDSTGALVGAGGTGDYPARYNKVGDAYFPLDKTYGPGGSYNKLVYNAALELNAFAWLLQKAAASGINPH